MPSSNLYGGFSAGFKPGHSVLSVNRFDQRGAIDRQIVAYITANIEDLNEGDYVLSRDQHDPDGSLVAGRITRKYERIADHLQIVGVQDAMGRTQTLQTTDEHPFHVAGQGWTASKLLAAGDELSGPGDVGPAVTSNARESRADGVTVYNMEIEGSHSYFVRAEGAEGEPVWVHNASYENTSVQDRIAAEIQLRPEEFSGSDRLHFSNANEGLAAMVEADEAQFRARYGDAFVDTALDGQTPEGWTWHHALSSQADGEAGWMHLMPRDYHRTNWGMLHPDGYGGYEEWAVPAGAPKPR